eukprot:CAMPEP_0117023782 /NCGR_PEP_ID=MMETSP0472-20121206/17722_1 /TAXON_ID=693140 ORGANISM="Tiarina fusus, Strain LIS" /NCGR_SAMPLE_ID=MMETSP0472 /ASSEMBLY_ACC=CAM_ASM_000603 /LENGTH=1260 /DNA_ID=CAMNT_0004730015 /DNA_START=189 /DNA_END=3971 /DNA_ORIENTATION=-
MTYISLGAYKEDEVPSAITARNSLDNPIGSVTGVFHKETNTIWSFEEDMPMVQLLEPMSKGVHRAVVVMADDTFKHISQVDVVKFGLKHSNFFSDTAKTLDELGLGNPSVSHVCTIPADQPALIGFRRMEMVNHTALPVVDPKSGAVISTLSASDVRNCVDSLGDMLKPASEFLSSIYPELEKPLTCSRSDTLGSLMEKLVKTNHRHIWVVDEEQRPISSVSLSDIINRMQGINEDLQSRALAVYGRGAMKKLFATKVLISGINGLGAEIAKNVILANVNSVTLHDTKNTTFSDLNSHFYLSENDVGKNRAESCIAKLAELNPSVRVTACTAEVLTDEILAQHNLVVLLESSDKESVRINNFCHSNSIRFIKTDIKGLAGSVFCDFGPNFEVVDVNGEQPDVAIVQEINKAGRVQCVNEEMLSMQEGDFVTFSEVKGMVELNEGEYQIENVTPYSFTLKNIEGLSTYESGGIVTQVKKPKTINFETLEEKLKACDMIEPPDYSKFDRHFMLHSAFRALDSYQEKNNRAPRPANNEDAEEFFTLWKEFNSKLEYPLDVDANKKVVFQFAHGAGVVINPMAAAFGGIVGQEVTKAATGKFHPINQWLYIDAFEVLPDELLDSSEYEPKQCRYDAQIQLLGKTFQEKLSNLNYFLVGSGALGCEFIKNFAMTGLGCGDKGKITVTDDDVIEKSNLSRQFLFRNWHIHKSKSLCATESAVAMNPSIKIEPRQDRVAPTTEDVFDDAFWESLDGVCNALDNVKARLYVDQRCIFYEKSLLESGTLGPKCNSQVIIPHKTRHYGDQPDQPEKQAPVCVLHHFPHNIQHCLTWGRSEFNGNFEVAPSEVTKYAEDPKYVETLKEAQIAQGDIKEKLEVIGKVLKMPCKTFADCVRWARLEYEDNFVNKIVELTHNLPRDYKTSTGAPFWSPPKRFPSPVPFNADDPVHMQYIMAGANLKASTFNVERPRQHRKPDFLKEILATIEVPTFTPSAKKIKTSDEDEGESYSIEDLQKQIPSGAELKEISMTPEDFEKDDDTNFHMDFIGAAANLRARNYDIEEVDKLKAKLIAGRIIPAIATATALATGFVMLELFKMVNNRPMGTFAETGAYRCSSNNLAIPQFSFFEPLTPIEIVDHVEKHVPDPTNHPEYVEEEDIVAYPPKHTIWDKIFVKTLGTEFTLQELIDYFKKEHELVVDGISVSSPEGKALLVYASFMKNTHDRLPNKFADLVKERTNEDIRTKKYYLPCINFNKGGDSVVSPPVVLQFK